MCVDISDFYYDPVLTPPAGVPFVSAKGTKTSCRRTQIMHFYSARRRRFLRRTHSRKFFAQGVLNQAREKGNRCAGLIDP
ncbi:MAG: hypothetical protein IJB48_00630, partial [Clostridia bacterium]|nr:hypothetical protein [Clostridia bacterium]